MDFNKDRIFRSPIIFLDRSPDDDFGSGLAFVSLHGVFVLLGSVKKVFEQEEN